MGHVGALIDSSLGLLHAWNLTQSCPNMVYADVLQFYGDGLCRGSSTGCECPGLTWLDLLVAADRQTDKRTVLYFGSS